MQLFPNELIIEIYGNCETEDICKVVNNNLFPLDFMIKKRKPSWKYAVNHGHLETIKWLHAERFEGCTTDIMDIAAENGHIDIVKFLHENRTEGCSVLAMYWAYRNRHYEVVKFLHRNRTSYLKVVKYKKVTQWLELVRLKCDEWTMASLLPLTKSVIFCALLTK